MEGRFKVVTSRTGPNKGLVTQLGMRDRWNEVRGLPNPPSLAKNLPNNSSVSFTLSHMTRDNRPFSTTTSVFLCDKLTEDVIYLNGERQDPKKEDHEGGVPATILRAITKLRRLSGIQEYALVVSENTFPTAAGLSSSASGGAAVIHAASIAFGFDFGPSRLAQNAREVSGSATRGFLGGFVFWYRGTEIDGTDSYAVKLHDEKHWSQLVDVIAVVDDSKKAISSLKAHHHSVESPFYKERIDFAERSAIAMMTAIKNRNFRSLAEITMADSDSVQKVLRSVGINYLMGPSEEIREGVIRLNHTMGRPIAAYSFALGPNVHIVTTMKHQNKIEDMIRQVKEVKDVMIIGVGHGPVLLGQEHSLIDPEALAPIKRS